MTEEKKQLLVEVTWIRPTKICAIFDLILAILCYLIALASSSWVIEKYEYEDETKDIEIDYNKYWVGLWKQCFRVSRAKELLDVACIGDKNAGRGDQTNQVEMACGPEYNRLIAAYKKDREAEECIPLGNSLPWADGLTFSTLHFMVTKILLLICLVVCVVSLVVALFIYCRNNKKHNLSHIYKYLGIVLFVVFLIDLAGVIYFGIAFTQNAPYSSEDWFFWTGYGFFFAASVLVLIAAILFFFGSHWKKNGYTHRRTVNL